MRTRRITADIDTLKKYKVAFYVVRAIFVLKARRLELRRSSRKGYHLIVWTKESGTRNNLRRYLGDDQRRIRMDNLRGAFKQTLFNRKRNLK